MTDNKIDNLLELCEIDDVQIIDMFPDDFVKENTIFDSTKDLFAMAMENYARSKFGL